MRSATVAFFSGFLILLVAGCGGDSAPASPLAPKLETAMAVSDPGARDTELVKLALEAATAGDVAIANSSLDAVANEGLRDQSKPKVILRLAKAAKLTAANKLIDSLSDAKMKDKLRMKIRGRDFTE
jgi:hypothetical protein